MYHSKYVFQNNFGCPKTSVDLNISIRQNTYICPNIYLYIRASIFLKKSFKIQPNEFKSHCTQSRDTTETIESGPLCTTDLFQNKSAAYF